MAQSRQQSTAIEQRHGNKTRMADQLILCPGCQRPNPARARFCQYCGRRVELNSQGSDHYRIVRVIKAGGMGAVYEALSDAERRYAIKELLDRFTDEQERVERIDGFIAEANLLTRLTHPCIPRVYSTFSDGGRYYLVMEYIDGEDLEQLIEREGPQPEARVLDWAGQLCDVLGYLHRNDLIYRDMKPSNVMLDRRNGGIKLVDFGITKAFQPSERGTLIGTPGYSPPEQYQGLNTPASDVYSLGATLHHLLTGRDPRNEQPFSFPPVRSLRPQVSRQTEAAIQRALAQQTHERWGAMKEFRRALLTATPRPAGEASAAPRPAQTLARPADSQPVLLGDIQTSPDGKTTLAQGPKKPRPRRLSWLRRLLRRMVMLTLILLITVAVLSIGYPDTAAYYLPWLPAVERYLEALPLLDQYLPASPS